MSKKKITAKAAARPSLQEALTQVKRLYGVGQLPAALAAIEAALAGVSSFRPPHAEFLNIGGAIALQLGDAAAADRYFRQAAAANPAAADALNNLGFLHMRLGNHAEAANALAAATQVQPNHVVALNNLGICLRQLGRFAEAEAAYRKAVAYHAGYAEAWNNLANLLRDQERLPEAERCYQQALALNPANTEILYNLGVLQVQQKKFAEAEAVLGKARAQNPQDVRILCEWIGVRRHLCQWEGLNAAEEELARSVEAPGADGGVLPFATLPLNAFTPLRQRAASQLFAAAKFGAALNMPPLCQRAVQPKDRLRIGYLSSDFHSHATVYLLAGVLERHDRERFGIYLYSYGPSVDSPDRQRIVAACDAFRDVRELSDRAAAEAILADEIDLLMDLKGYTAGMRAGICALRPAPVIVNWLGFPGTLGEPRLADYFIGDAVASPLAHAPHFSETLALLPNCYQPNDRQRLIAQAPTREAAGLPASGFVFGNFNQSYKTTPEFFAQWCRLLNAVPGSVLWLMAPGEATKNNLRRAAQEQGVTPERLIFAPPLDQAQHLGRLQLVDLALDTFPCVSHTTASDALWAGVPLVTRSGETFASRVAASVLQACGLGDLVTTDDEAYFALALALATSPERLQEVRARLAANRLSAPLFDTARYTQNLEAMFARIWAQEVAGERGAIVLEER